MWPEILDLLRCPVSGSVLKLVDAEFVEGRVRSGALLAIGGERYPIRDFIPRFVPESNYADSFGMQWNKFSRTQLDSSTGFPISADRFWKATNWGRDSLAGEWVLDVGCGAGRFAEAALGAGARVVALDYSSAVDACYANLARHANLHVLQADIYRLPLKPHSFPYVYCLGVLQHTPDVHAAFRALPPMLMPDGKGRLCVDYYERHWKARLLPKYALRPVTTKMDKARLFHILQRWVPALLAVSNGLARVPVAGSLLKRVVPVANYYGILPLNDDQQKEWALLDTFDWLSPAFDQPQSRETVRAWLEEARLVDIEVLKAGHLVGRGRSPASSAP